ncbi:MAG: prepilin-type N-terminal cleavage/methylation domain-containing protein [Chthoniobacterales bacterium]
MKTPPFPTFRKAFTLLEILAVVAILAILVSLLLPAMKSIRGKSQAAKCITNLRNWATAIQTYAAENNGRVQFKNWASVGGNSKFYEEALGGDKQKKTMTMDGRSVFATQLFRRCPAQIWDGSGNGPMGYSMSRPDPKESSVPTFNLRRAAKPSQLVLMMDATADGFVLNDADDFASYVAPLCISTEPRHAGAVNILFGDGHIAGYKWSQIDGDSIEEQKMLKQWFSLEAL